MQEAIPFRSWLPLYANNKNPLNLSSVSSLTHNNNNNNNNNISNIQGITGDMMSKVVSENAIIVFARRGCCMSHVMKRLLLGLGVNPPIYEVDDDHDESSVLEELGMINMSRKGDSGHDTKMQFPAVFIGGKLFGGLDRVMAAHISGELVPILKEAGALWL